MMFHIKYTKLILKLLPSSYREIDIYDFDMFSKELLIKMNGNNN